MSEELLQEETKAEASAEEMTMADLEEHFDDANPWNVVKDYMEKKTILPVKVEGIVNGGAIAMVALFQPPSCPYPTLRILKPIFLRILKFKLST